MKFWKERDKDCHDETKQRKRMLKWHEKIKAKAENSNEAQMTLRVKKRETKAQQCKVETVKRRINNVKEFERKIEKMPQNDMRRHFATQNCTRSLN